MSSWWDVLTGPPKYRANTPWGPAAAIGAVALIISVQLTLPLVLYGLSPELYQVSSGQTNRPTIWPQPSSANLALLGYIISACLLWFAAGLRNGNRRTVFSLPPVTKERAKTYVALSALVFCVLFAVRYVWYWMLSLLHGSMGFL